MGMREIGRDEGALKDMIHDVIWHTKREWKMRCLGGFAEGVFENQSWDNISTQKCMVRC